MEIARAEGSRSRETGGTGLGLAIANQLATGIQGSLILENRDGGGLSARDVPLARGVTGRGRVASAQPGRGAIQIRMEEPEPSGEALVPEGMRGWRRPCFGK